MRQSKSVMLVSAFVLAALIITAGGCTVGGGVKEYRDPAVPIEVEKGNEFAIALESNPTTGYQWRLAEPLDEKIITLEKSEYIEPETELMGAGGEEKWTFKAAGLGETTVSLIYIRPWEEQQEPATQAQTPQSTAAPEALAQGETTGQATQPATPGEAAQPAGEQPAGEQPTTMTFTVKVVKEGTINKVPKKYNDPNTAIEVEEDQQFAIALESNPTTGYSWQLAEPLDESVVELVSSEYEKKAGGTKGGEGEAVGSGGEEAWTFKAVGKGDTKISFKYVRPWEKDVAPAEEKAFSVTVTPVEESSGGGQ